MNLKNVTEMNGFLITTVAVLRVGLLIEEHISLSVLDTGFRHLGHTLVIKFIPQIVHIIPAVRYVVATWDQTGGTR